MSHTVPISRLFKPWLQFVSNLICLAALWWGEPQNCTVNPTGSVFHYQIIKLVNLRERNSFKEASEKKMLISVLWLQGKNGVTEFWTWMPHYNENWRWLLWVDPVWPAAEHPRMLTPPIHPHPRTTGKRLGRAEAGEHLGQDKVKIKPNTPFLLPLPQFL